MASDEDYAKLKTVLDAAYQQSAGGKGKERHAGGKPFDRQPILEIGRMVGPGFAIGQVMKKAQEAFTMASRSDTEPAMRELLGVIVYAAAAVVLINESNPKAEASRQDYAPARKPLSAFKDVSTVPTPRPPLSDSLRAVDRELGSDSK